MLKRLAEQLGTGHDFPSAGQGIDHTDIKKIQFCPGNGFSFACFRKPRQLKSDQGIFQDLNVVFDAVGGNAAIDGNGLIADLFAVA